MSDLLQIITSGDAARRNLPLEVACRGLDAAALLRESASLDAFRRSCDNLYHRVRALLFLYAIHRFHLPAALRHQRPSRVPFDGYGHLLRRRFKEAIDIFLCAMQEEGPSDGLSSALALAYRDLAFATLANQVRRSVRSVRGNQWMFRMGHPDDQPLRIRPELLRRSPGGPYPILSERTPVRMDLSHSAWSDIFFLGMDFPEGARVLNVSIDLAVHGRDPSPRPPIETYLRVIDEPVLRLVSVDLGASATISGLSDVFDFARDYLGLLKAALIASGIVPAGLEGSEESLADLLATMVGPGLGLEVVSSVNNIPKGSRLAVSTNLLASLISLCMRATGQARAFEGQLAEDERRLVAARAILGEWLGGSGGGWQDSGGIWPAMKLITGSLATEGDPEFGISRGRLLPNHRILDHRDVSDATRQALQDSLVLVHGGMAQNVGPILEMVTEKYLLRTEREWIARQDAMRVLDEILAALRDGDVPLIGAATTRNFMGPIQAIIPAASNLFTETVIARAKQQLGTDFWGFWMLGGMSGGGMGFIVAPARRTEAQDFLQGAMSATKRELEHALPFAMEPVVYDFAINARGTDARLLNHDGAMMPPGYYALMVPTWLRAGAHTLKPGARLELERLGAACRSGQSANDRASMGNMAQTLFDRLIPRGIREQAGAENLADLLVTHGFDREQHEQIRAAMKAGRIGLAQNRLPASTAIDDVSASDVIEARDDVGEDCIRAGREALASGSVAVVTLAAGAGSRWTQGAGVVKALHPFCKLAGRHRSFLELHLAKTRRTSRLHGADLPHVVTTSYLTHGPIARSVETFRREGHPGPVLLSEGKSVGLRLIPMVRDLRFAWEEMPQQLLDEQAQKMRDSLRAALVQWAESAIQGSDYTDNLPSQCLHPVGHWYEIPNLLRNGTLATLLRQRPGLRYLMLHNIDTLGADVAPALLGLHIQRGACLTFEVITRRIEDRGGGLARVDGRPRLLEGLAMPREEDEFRLSYYNTMTTWIAIDPLLAAFGLARSDLADATRVATAIRDLALRIPTYITLKDVKKRWGHGQEDVFPVAQFEKLWSDMTALREIDCAFAAVPRQRGQQLKEQAQLDGWLRDGSRDHVESLCEWT
ncbi:MAG TPA: UTP--glucose-1-phosphate uridylyltransferase [Verrucomicrobiae bacterium]|nr:UTP--glucose-1-phosphate uridylyltransferase [Verrucomicrobiae bacterium]